MIDVEQQCKGCGKVTPHVIDIIHSTGPRHGERKVTGHCQECGEKGSWVSWLVLKD